MRKFRRVSVLLLVLGLIIICSSCVPAPAAAPQAAAPAEAAADSEGTVLRTDWYGGYFADAYRWRTICCTRLMDMIFNPLVTVEYDYALAEIKLRSDGLAKEWAATEDNKEWTFYLRDDVRWHNGNPFTSSDVKFTYEMLLNQAKALEPAYPGWQASSLAELHVVGIEAVDDFTVRITTEEPQDRLPEKLSSIWILPRHILENVNLEPDKGPEFFSSRDEYENFLSQREYEFFSSQLVGTGAFKFVQHEHDQFVALERNPDFFRGEPKIEKLIAVGRLQDNTIRVALLEAGEVDVIRVTTDESGWHALDAARESPDFLVTGYWAVSNRVQEILPLGDIGDLPSYHREEQWVITEAPAQTPQAQSPSPAERILENIGPLLPLLDQNGLTENDFNFDIARGFPPDTEDFIQAGVPVRVFPANSIEELDNKILAIFYINQCVEEKAGCSESGQDMAVRTIVSQDEIVYAQFVVWDEASQSEAIVEEVQAEVVSGLPPIDPPLLWFVIGNSHKVYIQGGQDNGIRICIPIPWHQG